MAYNAFIDFFTPKERLVISLAKKQGYIKKEAIYLIYVGNQNAKKAIQRLLFFKVLLEDTNPNILFYNYNFKSPTQSTLELEKKEDQ